MKIKKHQKNTVIMCIGASIIWSAFGFALHPLTGIIALSSCLALSGAIIINHCIEK